MQIEIISQRPGTSKKSHKAFVGVKFTAGGKSGWATIWDTEGFQGLGKYEAEVKTEGEFTTLSGLKFLGSLPTTANGTPVAAFDPNQTFREKASTARTAVMTAKDVIVAASTGKTTKIADMTEDITALARVLFKEMESLALGKTETTEKETANV